MIFFSNINKPEKAYWLGFLYADGYITSQHGGIGLGLNKKDKEHLIKFANFIGLDNYDAIKEETSTNSYRLILNDIHCYDDLVKIGFTPAKSYDKTDTVFKNIPDIYKKFFLLGFWDGDGYVSITGEGKNQTGCISNNENLIDSFVDFINSSLGESFCKKTNIDYPRIRIYTNKAKRFLDWLYQDAPVFLERKYLIYSEFKKSKVEDKPYRNIRKLPSNKFFVQKQYKNKKYTVGTFNTIKEAIEAYNKKAIEIGFPTQEYVGEFLKWEDN